MKRTMKTALISVYNKVGIADFARQLTELGFTIYASGGTARHLDSEGVKVIDVATLVGGGAILGHRVVTLSREVHAGLLARNIQADVEELARLGIPYIDLVCVDLYPLTEEIEKPGSSKYSVIEQTDIGGPTMIRSAAKGGRIVICDPHDRQKVISWLKAGGQLEDTFVETLASKAEFVVSKYCMTSATYRSNGKYTGIFGKQIAVCKYGENAYQAPATLYSTGSDDPLALDKFRLVEGTEPSYNNYCDIDRLLQTMTHIAAGMEVNGSHVRDIFPFIAVAAKHGNACGASFGQDVDGVLLRVLEGDPLAIHGGLVMTNHSIRELEAELLVRHGMPENKKRILDAVIAKAFSVEAVEILGRKNGKCRLLENEDLINIQLKSLDSEARFRKVRGGFLKQPNYTYVINFGDPGLKSYGHAKGSGFIPDLILAWAIGSTSNSNTITLVKDNMLIGNGVGQQDRVGAAKLAIERAERSGHSVRGAVAYSDSFFPFPDGAEVLIDAGVKAILTSSGSVNDQATIDVCTKHDIALYMIPDAIGRGFFGH